MNNQRWKNCVSPAIFALGILGAFAPLAEYGNGVIIGTVTDSSTGTGIRGAHVKLSIGLETLSAVTDSTGKFQLAGIPEGTGFPVSIEKKGYHTISVKVTVTDSIPSVVAVQLTDTFLRLLSPENCRLIAGTNVEIRWDAVGIGALRIEYSPNGGRNWMLIAHGVDAAQGVWVWTVPDIPSTEGYIRITDTMRPDHASQNPVPFVVTSI